MPILSHDGDLHYDDIGEGPPVVLLHGVTSTGPLEWRGIVGTLADDYRCVAPDLRGHGRSDRGSRPLTVAMASSNALGRARESGVAAFPSSGSSPTVERP